MSFPSLSATTVSFSVAPPPLLLRSDPVGPHQVTTRAAAVTGDLTCARSPVGTAERVGLVASPKRGGADGLF